LRDQKLPPAWGGPTVLLKVVVEEPEVGLDYKQISLENALKLRDNVVLGDQVEVLTRRGGSSTYMLGTDHLGRDILSRMIHGARVSLIIMAITLVIGGSIGTIAGLIAGYYGGIVDEIIMRVVDIFLALPLVLVALVLVVSVGQSFFIIVVVLILFIWVRFARQVRGEVLIIKHADYVALAKVAGASTPHILIKHIFPGVINTLIVVGTLQVSIVILVESTLSFLGAGVPPPTPAWGSMVADGRDFLADAWWIATMPGLAILLTVVSLNLFGDWMRDTLDPRLRQIK
jgi:peptide/nickel transport system permease protein